MQLSYDSMTVAARVVKAGRWAGAGKSVQLCGRGRGRVRVVATAFLCSARCRSTTGFGYNYQAPRRASMPRLVRLLVVRSRTLGRLPRLRRSRSTPARFEDVVRNLRNPDPKIRISAVRLLREAGYAEAISPLAAVVTDQVNEIQLEAIDAELSFFLVEPVPAKKRVALVVEVRTEGRAPAAFELGPLGVWPKPVPAELVDALLQAVDDENKKVRIEAIYTLGVIGSGSRSDAVGGRRRPADQGARPLRSGDPRRRRARRRPTAGEGGRRRAVEGGQ